MCNENMRESFEKKFPVPKGIIWSGNKYVPDVDDDFDLTLQIEMAAIEHQTRLETWQAALTQQPESEPAKGEQAAFAQLGVKQRWNMQQHPLHYLFLDEKTDAARTGWREGLAFGRQINVSRIVKLESQIRAKDIEINALRAYQAEQSGNDMHHTAVHYWLGDGEDDLESLCTGVPVVIEAQTLRELLQS